MSTEIPHTVAAERAHEIAAGLIAMVKMHGDKPDELVGILANAADELRALWEHTSMANGYAHEPGADLCEVAELADRLLTDHYQRRQASERHGGVVGVRSGLNHLDEVLNGLEAGKLYMMAAMPGAGKTTLALQMAATVAQNGEPALYISLENDAADLARKVACRLGGVSYAAALKGKVDPTAWQTAVSKLSLLGGRLYMVTPRTIMPELGEMIKDVKKRAGAAPSLVVVDYLQAYVKRSARGADPADVRERLDRLTPELRLMGEVYGCAVLAISSQNRAGYASGGMAAMKESGDIEYGADVTLSLSRPEKPPMTAPGLTALELRVDKNRHGMTGQPIKLVLNGDRCTITEIEA